METVVYNWTCGALPRAAQLLWGRLRNRRSCEITGTQARHCAHQTTVRAAITCLERNKSLKLEMTAPSKHHPEAWGSSSTCHWSVADLKLIHSVYLFFFSFREQWKKQRSEAGEAALTTSCAKEIINNSKRKQRLKGWTQVTFSEQQFPGCWKCCSPVQSTRSPPLLSLTVASFPGVGRHCMDRHVFKPAGEPT